MMSVHSVGAVSQPGVAESAGVPRAQCPPAQGSPRAAVSPVSPPESLGRRCAGLPGTAWEVVDALAQAAFSFRFLPL